MKKVPDILLDCPLFGEIGEKDLAAVLGCLGARTARFAKGETVLAEGSAARELGIVLSGSVQIERLDYDGNRSILSRLRPPEMMAEAFACAGVVSLPVEAVATEESEVMFIAVDRLTTTCTNACSFHTRMIRNLLRSVALTSIELNGKLEIVSRRSTREKLLSYLDREARRQGSDSFTVPFDRQALADYLEVERSGLSTEIGKLRREGIIDCHKSDFTLLRP